MPDLLLELLSEEIPARMQAQAGKDLERLVVGALSDRGLLFDGAKAFAGPRRLALCISGLPGKQPDVREEKKGPRVNAPAKAIDGFLRSAGVTREECEKRDDGKGEFFVAVIARRGRPTADVLREILPEVFARLPWPKSMRWGTAGAVRWVRPLHGIVCTFDGETIEFTFAGVTSGNTTMGHRFLSHGAIQVRRHADYEKKLREAHVVLDGAERRETILHEARQRAFALGLELVEDEGLLDEVAGLAEWPVVLMGTIEDQFMELPPEILRTSMRTHQKYFSLREPKEDRLANRFAFVSNMKTADGGKEIVSGNERVLRSRLFDAKFFWDHDRKTKLEDRVNALAGVVFHARLGNQLERVGRIELLAGTIAKKIGADEKNAKRAARLCKADLTSGVVGEFPELQGVMGRYYALHDGEDVAVADGIRDHYRPMGSSDAVPAQKVSMAVALAEKIDTLVEFFRIDERPTGSGDPFALRRAALGTLRIILENNLRFDLLDFVYASGDLLEFFVDRLKIILRGRGVSHDVLDAVFSIRRDGDVCRLVALAGTLQSFLKSDDGANLLVAYRRAANILKAEERKDEKIYDGRPDPEAFVEPQEKALFVELATANELVRSEFERERFVEAMNVMARLRRPVDEFFEKVTVNAPQPKLRDNRLRLLAHLRATLHRVADFSKIEG